MIVRLQHVKRVRSKGRTYWYHQLTKERLPDDRDARTARVLQINQTLDGTARKISAGSLADVIAQYKQAPEFRDCREITRRTYTIYLDKLYETWGGEPVASLRKKHVKALRDNYADTPAAANKIVSILSMVMEFAIDREYRNDNPALKVKKLATGPGYATWPEEAIDRFLASAPPMMVLALKLALYTGQRRGDVLAMSWSNYDGHHIQVVQSKTGAKLSIPLHSVLRSALDAQDRVSPIILTTETGRPFTGSSFNKRFRNASKAAGLSGLTFHGLRYTSAARLAEAGCSDKEIGAITGHKTSAMITKYTRGADQERLAGAAILRLESVENIAGTKIGKPR